MSTIKNIILVGASGELGTAVLEALINSGKFNIAILTRPTSISKGKFPSSINVVEADYDSVDSITKALKGQDAVVSTVGIAGLTGQKLLIEGAIAAGVKRFIPSEFGCDLSKSKTAALPVFGYKIPIEKQLQEIASSRADFSYSLVCNGGFLDWGLEKQFLFNWKDGKPKIYDGGDREMSVTTLASIGQAVVGVLSHPEETRNRFVYVKDIDITQNQIFDLVKKIDPEIQLEPMHLDTAKMEQDSNEKLAKGQVTMPVMVAYLFRALAGPPEYGGKFKKDDNELLGVKGKTLADVEQVLRGLMQA